ncbi:MAG: hypothetical protein M0Z53_01150 [Thermaerobacter sp.]|nr:hypothetical protein [Thermaerobacter sp.]
MGSSVVVLSHQDVNRQADRGATLVDIRTPRQYVQIHLANSWPVAGPRFGMPLLLDGRFAAGLRVVLIADTPVSGQVAADELTPLGIHVIGVLASQPSTWQPRGLKVIRGNLVRPPDFLTFLAANPTVEIVDVRESIEQELHPFAPATRALAFSQWPDILTVDDPSRPLLFVSGRDDRSVLAAWWAFQRGFSQVGYLVGGIIRYLHGDGYDPRAIARTTAGHGVFI